MLVRFGRRRKQERTEPVPTPADAVGKPMRVQASKPAPIKVNPIPEMGSGRPSRRFGKGPAIDPDAEVPIDDLGGMEIIGTRMAVETPSERLSMGADDEARPSLPVSSMPTKPIPSGKAKEESARTTWTLDEEEPGPQTGRTLDEARVRPPQAPEPQDGRSLEVSGTWRLADDEPAIGHTLEVAATWAHRPPARRRRGMSLEEAAAWAEELRANAEEERARALEERTRREHERIREEEERARLADEERQRAEDERQRAEEAIARMAQERAEAERRRIEAEEERARAEAQRQETEAERKRAEEEFAQGRTLDLAEGQTLEDPIQEGRTLDVVDGHTIPSSSLGGLPAFGGREAFLTLHWFQDLVADGEGGIVYLYLDHARTMGWLTDPRHRWLESMATGLAPRDDTLSWADTGLTPKELARQHLENLRVLDLIFTPYVPVHEQEALLASYHARPDSAQAALEAARRPAVADLDRPLSRHASLPDSTSSPQAGV